MTHLAGDKSPLFGAACIVLYALYKIAHSMRMAKHPQQINNKTNIFPSQAHMKIVCPSVFKKNVAPAMNHGYFFAFAET